MAGRKQIALQPLLAEAKRAIAGIAEAERRLFLSRDEILDGAWQTGKILVGLKERVGRRNWYLWLSVNLPELRNVAQPHPPRPHRTACFAARN